jgi:outer membrane receptor protein involved in Fe transport
MEKKAHLPKHAHQIRGDLIMMSKKMLQCLLSALAVSALPTLVFAQGAEDDDEAIEEIVVTGTGVARTTFETPQSVVQFSEEDFRQMQFNSQADILTQLPGVSAEGGGGEVATNVFHRALPSGGQFSFNPLLFDGMPAFTTFGLNSSAFDVFYRPDLGIERAEFVAAGSSNLFEDGLTSGVWISERQEPFDPPRTTPRPRTASRTPSRRC